MTAHRLAIESLPDAFANGAGEAKRYAARRVSGTLPPIAINLPHTAQRTRAEAAAILCWNRNSSTRRHARYWLEWVRGFESIVPLPGDAQ